MPAGDRGARSPTLQAKFPAGLGIRCRSSTNNEDLEGFNGAGLYDSFTHRADEGDLAKTVKQVWASLWNLRAFDEREFHRIDHLAAAMGVLVHPNFDDEVANGVAVTKNPFDPNWDGFYVNVQVGESLVTNPDPNATPDELLVSAIGPNGEYETQYIRRSTLTTDGKSVMTADADRRADDGDGDDPAALQGHLRRAAQPGVRDGHRVQDRRRRQARRQAGASLGRLSVAQDGPGAGVHREARPATLGAWPQPTPSPSPAAHRRWTSSTSTVSATAPWRRSPTTPAA